MTQLLTIWKVGSPHYGETPTIALPEDIGSMAHGLVDGASSQPRFAEDSALEELCVST